MSEKYRIVTAIIRRVRDASIMVEVPRRQEWVSIPRSLIFGPDDLRLDRLDLGPKGTEHTFRLMEWKAEEVGLS